MNTSVRPRFSGKDVIKKEFLPPDEKSIGKLPVSDTLKLANKITFAQVESAVSQQVIGGRHMKIEIRQHKAQQIALAGELYGVTPEL